MHEKWDKKYATTNYEAGKIIKHSYLMVFLFVVYIGCLLVAFLVNVVIIAVFFNNNKNWQQPHNLC